MREPARLADTVRDLYAALGVGQRQAARLIGVNADHFRQMCRGRRPVPQAVIDNLQELVRRQRAAARNAINRRQGL